MSERNFFELLKAQQERGKFLCVGLDPDETRLPRPPSREPHSTVRIHNFNVDTIRATLEYAAAYKPNIAFYARKGPDGLAALKQTVSYINDVAPDRPVILDAKRADIGNTNIGYMYEAFEYVGADAITVNPYFGEEALRPFLNRAEKGIFILCRTSNPGAGEFQDLMVRPSYEEADDWNLRWQTPIGAFEGKAPQWDEMPIYQFVAYRVSRVWNKNDNCALVVGATCPEELGKVRAIVGNMQILIPGIGTQGGGLKKAVANGKNSKDRGFLINVSSGIMFAPDPAAAARDFDRNIRAELMAAA